MSDTNPMIIGLTGGIGCGKTTISDEFARLGITIVDADVIARQVVEPGTPGLEQLIQRFGIDMLHPDGTLNRTALRNIIFTDPSLTQWVNALLHPLIRTKMLAQLKQSQSSYTILSVPLLFENNLDKLCDRVIVVDINHDTQIARITKRDSTTEENAEAIIKAQIDRPTRLKQADDIIDNSGSIKDSIEQVSQLHAFYTKMINNGVKSKIKLEN